MLEKLRKIDQKSSSVLTRLPIRFKNARLPMDFDFVRRSRQLSGLKKATTIHCKFVIYKFRNINNFILISWDFLLTSIMFEQNHRRRRSRRRSGLKRRLFKVDFVLLTNSGGCQTDRFIFLSLIELNILYWRHFLSHKSFKKSIFVLLLGLLVGLGLQHMSAVVMT